MVTAQPTILDSTGFHRDGRIQAESRENLFFQLNVARNQVPELLLHPETTKNHSQANGHGSNGMESGNSGVPATKAIDIHRSADGLAHLPLGGHKLAELERETIQQTLSMYKGNRKRSAAILGISVRTLQRKIKQWNIA
ncbi:helix-turn-helix domain-containing protein [Bythopirellula polymerisocia]|uniref:Bacterial regulatory protein, Fis family n=1 Tax=Bythopirellula polymerisocia TaxID=2528003 RepID=A0A5C6CDQ7_9BACT|nr:helix-turn-helix domain-containing protein [Bythopirellula polymerisocia]TWU21887.1 Bacterial regulatory protein, Fis family [Bythopirellula polymerisocia]